MSDIFTKAGSVSSVINRKGQSSASGRFAELRGCTAASSRTRTQPPAEFPETGTAASRRFRRVELPVRRRAAR